MSRAPAVQQDTRTQRRATRAEPSLKNHAPTSELQAFADNSVPVQKLSAIQRLADDTSLQRKVYTSGSKNAQSVKAPPKAIAVAKRSQQAKFNAGGKNHLPAVAPPHGGYKLGGNQFVGGSVFSNNAMPDGTFLPKSGGQTYTEWDVNAYVQGQNRGAERVVVSSDGKFYYTNDHYANFSEFKV